MVNEVDEVVNATHSVLVAQVRHADASHKIDTAHQLLRGVHYSGPSRVVYLGDIAKAILAGRYGEGQAISVELESDQLALR